MKPTYNSSYILDEDGTLIGINLGADFTAKHERGIQRLKEGLGIDDRTIMGKKILGVAGRRVQNIPEKSVYYQPRGKYTTFGLFKTYYFEMTENNMKINLKHQLPYSFNKFGLKATWNEGGFGIQAKGKDQKYLKQIYEAFTKKDMLVQIGKFSNNPFENAGLMLLIESNLPKEWVQAAHDVDFDHEALLKASEKTGIEKLLKKAGKTWFALSPKWSKDFKDKEGSKYDVIYWLNPMDQDIYNSGWFTTEQLQLWAENKGPIIKKGKI